MSSAVEQLTASVVLDPFAALLPWVVEATGGEVLSHERLATIRPTWKIFVRVGQEPPRPYIIRCARPSGFGLSETYSLVREVEILKALNRTQLPVPEVIAVSTNPDAVLLECMSGAADFSLLENQPERKASIVNHFIELLAEQHALSLETLKLDHVLPVPRAPTDAALLEVDSWEKVYRQSAKTLDPLLLFTFSWLRANPPSTNETVLVHGDTGPNQCLYDQDSITAVLDWELSHYGDPMDDLGCLAARAFFTYYGDLRAIFKRYEELSEYRLDIPRIAYYRMLSLMKFEVAMVLARESMGAADDLASIICWESILRLSIGYCLAEAYGLPVAPLPPVSLQADRDISQLHRILIEVFNEQAQVETNSFHRQRLGGLADVVRYTALQAAEGGRLAEADRADWERLGRELGVRSGQNSDVDLCRLVSEHAERGGSALAGFFYAKEQRIMTLVQRSFGVKKSRMYFEPIS